MRTERLQPGPSPRVRHRGVRNHPRGNFHSGRAEQIQPARECTAGAEREGCANTGLKAQRVSSQLKKRNPRVDFSRRFVCLMGVKVDAPIGLSCDAFECKGAKLGQLRDHPPDSLLHRSMLLSLSSFPGLKCPDPTVCTFRVLSLLSPQAIWALPSKVSVQLPEGALNMKQDMSLLRLPGDSLYPE
ncbi:hypothetical protein H1C71_018105 [Ictidomys tridecemlineatus]|nr:hypothetical protein H1C71_018105 [Ictidomys tridecemlineatus]